ncbi:TIGR00282 family metallophosphoesterase [Kiloniella laminariae]|uniref:TIGR00282 family metallophosphoesterase n=1 Tax=Kiloniella laminariae TaxID=454162 RepID=A0ABT4LI85_9PROT|nr:TIGR00282 family metallophosphoesterase [Kiloniella laminariae]MCZ4280818.1 TIGR00282 family metallophosphoesterase [Kiloniella laminariae]
MRLLFCGDVVGRSGRDAIAKYLPGLRRDLKLDFVVVNGENAASGFGITEKICKQFIESGADVVSGGNHSWDQRESLSFINNEARLLRPVNFPEGAPGRGAALYEAPGGRKVMVINAMGRVFMDPMDDPFAVIAKILERYRLGTGLSAVIVDFHGEATSEKMAMGHFLDGKVSLVVGTHTHVPTADHTILPGGTAYQSDVGMTGDFDSVIGMKKEVPIMRFTRKLPTERMSPATGEATLCALFVETDDKTGLALRVEPVRIGGRLSQSMPEVA